MMLSHRHALRAVLNGTVTAGLKLSLPSAWLSLVGVATCADLVDDFGVGKTRNDGSSIHHSSHRHAAAKQVHIALDTYAHRISAIDEIRFVEAEHDDSPSLRYRSNGRYCEDCDLCVNDQAEQGDARCD
ncbi:hypothetical protein D3C77_435780 [compost metagenome]